MIIGSGVARGLLMVELLGTLDFCETYCKGAAMLFFRELLTTAYGSG